MVNHWMDTDQYLVNDGLAVGSKNARLSQVLYICVSLDKNKCMPTVFSIGQIQLSAQSLGRALPTCSPPVSCPLNPCNGHCSVHARDISSETKQTLQLQAAFFVRFLGIEHWYLCWHKLDTVHARNVSSEPVQKL